MICDELMSFRNEGSGKTTFARSFSETVQFIDPTEKDARKIFCFEIKPENFSKQPKITHRVILQHIFQYLKNHENQACCEWADFIEWYDKTIIEKELENDKLFAVHLGVFLLERNIGVIVFVDEYNFEQENEILDNFIADIQMLPNIIYIFAGV